MEVYVIIAILAAMAFAVWFLRFRKKKHDGVFRGMLPNTTQGKTPKGVTIKAYGKVDTRAYAQIDQGLDVAFDIAERVYGYTGFKRHASYTVYIFPRSQKCINPAFLVDGTGSPYDQSEWDKNPEPGKIELCAAGMMMRDGLPGDTDLGNPGMVITDDIGQMANAVRYEAEHNILIECDIPKFLATRYHTQGQGHPILPDSNELVVSSQTFSCAGVGRVAS